MPISASSHITLLVDTPIGPGAQHGLCKVARALQKRGDYFSEVASLSEADGDSVLVLGLPNSPAASALAAAADITLPVTPESILIHATSYRGTATWLVVGGDDRGLMYALLDVADRIDWALDPQYPLSELRETRESPEVRVRSLSIYTMHKRDFERRLFNEAYWARYLDMLAQNRFNTFALLFAYESAGYMAPPYPYFFDVPGFPGVKVSGYTPKMQTRGLDALNRLVAMTHERALGFTLGIWDHVYRGGVQTGGVTEAHDTLRWRVTGLTQENLMDYSVAALTELLRRVPNLDALQFRMHNESGLIPSEMDAFWARIYDVTMAHAPDLRFDARVKEFPDHLIDLALEKGVKIRLCTKYWMEQMGLPFHPTHVHPQNQHDRRHGYADLLRYPQRYTMLWRLWNGGTNRATLWGDPDYARRFAESTHLYNGEGFDVNEPLATKMAAHDHDAAPFELLNPAYRSYDWEFERYWHFYQVFGRLGYNPETPSEVWEREFEHRFGRAAAPHVAHGLHLASRILPRIVAYTYPYSLFPTTRGWIEKEHMGDLPAYAAALPSDTEQFLSIADEARNQIEGSLSAKLRPQASAAWFSRISAEVLAQVTLAEGAISDHRGPEFDATMADLRILAYLALYHARRAHAGVQWVLFERVQDLNALDSAIEHETQAIAAWEQLVASAGDVYAGDLMMGLEEAGLSGHWRDELIALRRGLIDLEASRDGFQPPAFGGKPRIAHAPVRRAMPGHDLVLRATVSTKTTPVAVQVCYSSDGDTAGSVAMAPIGPWRYEAVIPGDAVRPETHYRIEATDAANRTATCPAQPEDSIAVIVTDDDAPPVIQHSAIHTAPAGKPLTVRVTAKDPSGVQWVRLRYRSVTQVEDYRTLEMLPSGRPDEYVAEVPGENVDPGWDFMYFIEAMDAAGNGAIYPDLETETPYIVVRTIRRP